MGQNRALGFAVIVLPDSPDNVPRNIVRLLLGKQEAALSGHHFGPG